MRGLADILVVVPLELILAYPVSRSDVEQDTGENRMTDISNGAGEVKQCHSYAGQCLPGLQHSHGGHHTRRHLAQSCVIRE